MNKSKPDYEIRVVDGFKQAFTLKGEYIGSVETAQSLQDMGIVPELRVKNNPNTCTIGFCAKEHKWYGWSHRAIAGFGLGHTVKTGDAAIDKRQGILVGFEVKTLDDAKKVAASYAESIS